MKVLDTSAIINDPEILRDQNTVVPYCVLGELDNLKNKRSTRRPARRASKIILHEDVPTKEFSIAGNDLPVDDKLVEISTLDSYSVLTSDVLLYLKADSKEVASITFLEAGGSNEPLYEGVKEIEFPQQYLDSLYQHNKLDYDRKRKNNPGLNLDLHENQFIDSGQVIARYYDGSLYALDWNKEVKGVGKLNRRQMMAADLLLDHRVKVVAMAGRAGTGKTSLAMNQAIKQVQHYGEYENLIISRPRIQAGGPEEEMGYLPGSVEEKTLPFLQPFFDNDNREHAFAPEILPLSMIQGRNIEHSIWIITEFQNVRKEDADAIVERLGKGSKLIVEGDINQDNRQNGDNGLSFLINALKDEKMVGSVVLKEVERSDVSKLGATLREKM